MSGAIVARSRVVAERDNFGRFKEACRDAAHDTVKRTVELGAKTSRSMAPAGKARFRYANRPGYIPLKRSIKTSVSGNTGYWYSIAPHAMFVEFGTGAHTIMGRLRFTWSGGTFFWANPKFGPVGSGLPYENWTEGQGAWVRHPGTQAQPFLRPAYERVVKRQMMDIARSEFPG